MTENKSSVEDAAYAYASDQVPACIIGPTLREAVRDQIAKAYMDATCAALEQAAKVAEQFALERGPTQVKSMGGWVIAERIRKLSENAQSIRQGSQESRG